LRLQLPELIFDVVNTVHRVSRHFLLTNG